MQTPSAYWRAMCPSDLGEVEAIAALCHPDYPEEARVFSERLRIFPSGCAAFVVAGHVAGYLLSHPDVLGRSVPLNCAPESLPVEPDALYIHDLALAPDARGKGGAVAAVGRCVTLATSMGLKWLALVAVNNSRAFWQHQGFLALTDPRVVADPNPYGAGSTYMARKLGA